MVVDPDRIAFLRRLIALGCYSVSETSALAGVSRDTVRRVATGRRKDRPRRKPRSNRPRTGPVRPCPTCGARCVQPCLACEVRATLRGAARRLADAGEPLELNLLPKHRRRYERLRRLKAEVVAATGDPAACVPAERLRAIGD